MLQVELEAATTHDVDSILRLRDTVAAWLASLDVNLWQSPLPPERLRRWMDEGEVLLQRDGAHLVGTVALLDRDEDIWSADGTPAVYVHLLMVHRAYAGQDLGGRMLEQVEVRALGRGARYARLDAGSDLERLHRWYQQRGYAEVATRTIVDGAERFEVTLREKELAPSRRDPGPA